MTAQTIAELSQQLQDAYVPTTEATLLADVAQLKEELLHTTSEIEYAELGEQIEWKLEEIDNMRSLNNY